MQDRNLTEGLEISSALSSGSYRKVKYKRMRVSRSGMLIVHNLLLGCCAHDVTGDYVIGLRHFEWQDGARCCVGVGCRSVPTVTKGLPSSGLSFYRFPVASDRRSEKENWQHERSWVCSAHFVSGKRARIHSLRTTSVRLATATVRRVKSEAAVGMV